VLIKNPKPRYLVFNRKSSERYIPFLPWPFYNKNTAASPARDATAPMLLLLGNLPLEAIPVDAVSLILPGAVEPDPNELDVVAVLIIAVAADPVMVPVVAALARDAAAVAAMPLGAADV